MKLIGITGKAGSGKDTVAAYLKYTHGYEQVSFAAILKSMLAVAGMPEPVNREDKEKVITGLKFSWREAAQKLGTEWGRSLDSNLWVNLTTRNLQEGKSYVISDVRFDNEAEAIRNAGGTLIHLIGRECDLGDCSTHPSEAGVEIDHFKDYTLTNNGTIDDLYTEIEDFLKWYKS